jgi:hypothetical protein
MPGMAEVRCTRNSSITRVRPFFGQLLARDRTGADWLPALLRAVGGHETLEPGVIDDALVACRSYKDRVLKASVWLPQCFEHSLAPTGRLLEWCLRHPDQLTWPTKGGKRETYSDDAMKWRSALKDDAPPGVAAAQEEGLRLLNEKGVARSKKQWWAFEGFTEVDCLLRTPALTLLVEGKRTEELSEQTSWLSGRNQLARNLEAAAHADGDAVVILATEHLVELDVEQLVADGCPHVTDAAERAAITACFLGQATWDQLCVETGVDKRSLPEAIAITPEAP